MWSLRASLMKPYLALSAEEKKNTIKLYFHLIVFVTDSLYRIFFMSAAF